MQENATFHLRVESGPGTGQRFPVTGTGATIGRQAGNTIVLEDERLSRRHARLDLGPGGLTVTDFGSANGTLLNGEQLAPNQARPLRPGDTLNLGGGVTLVIEASTVPEPAPAPGDRPANLTARSVPAAPPTPTATPDPAAGAPPAAPAVPAGGQAPSGPRARAAVPPLPVILGGVFATLLLCVCVGIGSALVLMNRGGGGSGGGDRPSQGRQRGVIAGAITDARGKPIQGAEFTVYIRGTTVAGERTSFYPQVDKNGRYTQRVPEGVYAISARMIYEYNGKRYDLDLHPTDDQRRERTHESRDGVVKDFQWRTTGLEPGEDASNQYYWYGGRVQPKQASSDDYLNLRYPGGTIEVTLTPRGPLIDGSTGKTITQRLPTDQLNRAWIDDVPIGRYTATAKVIAANGAEQSLELSAEYYGAPFAATLDLEFKPATGGVDAIYLYMK